MFQLISATPSPYARKVRIALAEKGIPFELRTEVPWDSTTATPRYNPLEKLPVLILNASPSSQNSNGEVQTANGDGEPEAVYESHYILEWLETKYGPRQGYKALLPSDDDERLKARKIEVLADGICDALLLLFFERMRSETNQSKEWMARQRRKVDGGLKALASYIDPGKPEHFMIGGELGLADIAAGSVVGYMKVRFQEHPWQKDHPHLARWSEWLEERESFRTTRPSAQKISDKVV